MVLLLFAAVKGGRNFVMISLGIGGMTEHRTLLMLDKHMHNLKKETVSEDSNAQPVLR